MNVLGFLVSLVMLQPAADWQSDRVFFTELAGRDVDVPVSTLAQSAYEQIVGQPPANDAGLMVCKASVGNLSTDLIGPVVGAKFARTDLGLIITVTQGHGWKERIVAKGKDNSGEAYFFLPAVDLSKPYQLLIEAYDRDIYRHDKLEYLTIAAEPGNQWRFTGKKTIIDCQAVAAWLFAQYFDQQNSQYKVVLHQLAEISQYSLTAPVLSSVDKILDDAHENLRQIAGMLGWKSPEVTKRIEELAIQEGRIKQLVLDAYDQQLFKSKDSVTIGSMVISATGHFGVDKVSKDLASKMAFFNELDKNAVFLKMKVENKGPEPLTVSNGYLGPVMLPILIAPDGETDYLKIEFELQNGQWVKVPFDNSVLPGATKEFLLSPGDLSHIQRSENLPLLMRLDNGDGYSFLLFK